MGLRQRPSVRSYALLRFRWCIIRSPVSPTGAPTRGGQLPGLAGTRLPRLNDQRALLLRPHLNDSHRFASRQNATAPTRASFLRRLPVRTSDRPQLQFPLGLYGDGQDDFDQNARTRKLHSTRCASRLGTPLQPLAPQRIHLPVVSR